MSIPETFNTGGYTMVGPAETVFHRDYQPEPSVLKEYQKKVTTKAVKVAGPFAVETSEGWLHCRDGYLCIDARGYLYPVATEEFDLIYEPVASPTSVIGDGLNK